MPNHYPQEAVTRDGRRLLLRPLSHEDSEGLYDLFQRLPLESRRFDWNRIDDRSFIEFWAQNLNYDQIFPVVAVDGAKVVAEVTLERQERGPLRLVGRVHWLLDPDYRGVGLGTLLVNHVIGVARARGLHHLTCMLISDLEADAVAVLQGLGFRSYSFPDYGTDPDGNQHDMTKMVLQL